MEQRSVVITGGLGFIGSNIAARCVKEGDLVTICDNEDAHSGTNRHNIDEVLDRVTVKRVDVRDAMAIEPIIEKADIVFHCAAQTSHAFSMVDPLQSADVNIRGTLVLLESVRKTNPGLKLVYVGTSTQLGRMVYSPGDENHPEFPLDAYSASKTAGEKYVLLYSRAFGLHTTAVRIPNIYGPRAHIETAKFGFVNYFIGLALRGKEITVFGDGRQSRNLLYVDDAVSALVAAAESAKSDGEVFFASSDTQMSVAEIAQGISSRVGGTVTFVPWPKERAAIEVGDACISNTKIRNALGWQPRIGFDEGLSITQAYYRAHIGNYLQVEGE